MCHTTGFESSVAGPRHDALLTGLPVGANVEPVVLYRSIIAGYGGAVAASPSSKWTGQIGVASASFEC